jgi:3-methylcrotonyl-CoA carboxylase beta subunit
MPVLKSAIDVSGAKFAANRAAMEALTEDLRARTAEAALGGPEDSRWPPMACMTAKPPARG